MLTLVEDFRWFGRLFQSFGPRKERILSPRFVLWFGIRSLLNDLRVTCLCSTGKYISDMYAGAVFAKYLKISTQTLWSNLSFVGSQFMALNSAAPTCDLSPRLRQNRIHLFWAVCIFLQNFLFKQGYQAGLAKSKWGWIKALQSSLFKLLDKKLCLR